jgi:DNA-binding transcriptional MerR regulator
VLIGTMARQTGVSARLLRYYEEQGLLAPRRRPSGFRDYREQDVHAVRHIRALLAAGLSTRAIAAVMPCLPGGDGLAPVPPSADLLAGLRRERVRLRDAAAGLLAACEVLDAVIASAQVPHC